MAGKRKKVEVAAAAGGREVPRKRPAVSPGQAAEEEDFPRGGASALTPAEIQEARAQADEEFKNENKSQSKKHRKDVPLKGKHKSLTEENSTLFSHGLTGKLPKSVDILRYKSLCVGMKMWGAVAEINNKDLVVSLPGGLRGFVRAEEASEVLAKDTRNTKKRRKKEKSSVTGNNHGDAVEVLDEDEEVVSLVDLFSIGQLVACTVCKLELSKSNQEKKSRRIELSLCLYHLYEGLTIDAVHEGQAMTATVSSLEDHGYLLSFGVPAMSGFLLHSNYMDGKESPKLRMGQLVQGVVVSVDKKRGTVGLKASPSLVASTMVKEYAGLTLELLTPGSMVHARVRAVTKNGLLLSFLTYFTGTVDIFHLETPLPGPSWSEKYSENQRVKARILFVDPVKKSVGLSLNPQLINYTIPTMAPAIGDVFENAVVHRVDPTLGILVELPLKNSSAAAYIHISNVSDEHVAKLGKKYCVGKKVRARVVGFRVMDGLAIASLKDSVVEQLLISHADVKPAMIVRGTVAATEPFGSFIQLADGLRALCPLQHMSDFQRTAPSAKFQVGARLKFRVLTCDTQTRKITLTHKKTLVISKLKPITSYEDAVEGLVTHGFITGFEDYGCFVSFYNDVKGLAHRKDLGIDAGVKADTVFEVGQSIKCRVLRCDPASCRLSLSFVTSSHRGTDQDREETGLKVGELVSGTVAHVADKVFILDVMTDKELMKGILTFPHLSDTSGHVEGLKGIIKVGHKLEQLLVLDVTDKQKLILSAKYSLVHRVAELPSDISQVQVQAVIPGYIANITEKGCFVRFLKHLTGLASIPQVADEFVSDANHHFTVGQSVRAHVLEVNQEACKFSVSLKQSLCFSTDASLLHGYFLEEDKIVEASGASNLEWTESLAIGTCVEGEIQEIKDYGVIVNVPKHKDIVGFVTHYQLGGPVEVGQTVQARVLDVAKADGIVDLTLRTHLLQVKEPEPSSAKKEKNKLKRSNPATTENLQKHQKVTAVVELIKDDYLVLSLLDQGNSICFASTGDYNLQVKDAHQRYHPGQRLPATVEELADEGPGGRILLLLGSFTDPVVTTVGPNKRPRHERKIEVGSLVDAEVLSVEQLHLILSISKSGKGRVHITEVKDEFESGNPLSSFVVGQKVKAKVLVKPHTKRTASRAGVGDHLFELSLRPSQLTDVREGEQAKSLPSFATLAIGQAVTAYVQEVTEERAWLLVAPHVRGRLFILDSSTDPTELQSFKERFTIGTAVHCCVKAIDHSKGTVDFTLVATDNNFNNAEIEVPQIEGQDPSSEDSDGKRGEIKEGEILGGRISRLYPGVGGLSVQIAPSLFGRVHITHMSDTWRDNPVTHFREGQFVRCVVLEVKKSVVGKPQIDLSLRSSLGGSEGSEATHGGPGETEIPRGNATLAVNTIQDLKEGLLVQGYVKNASNKGCFVTLSRHVDARVLISNLSDSYVVDPSESFPPGKLVTGRIVSVEHLSGRVEMSLKSLSSGSIRVPEGGILGRHFADFNVGDIVFGLIKRIESFGLFISIEQSSLVGMCHVSEVADHYVKNIQKHYKVGDRVRARILKMDEGNERISLGLKESYFPELGDEMEQQSEGEAPDEVIQSNAGTRIKTVDDVMADKDEDIEGDENEEKEEDSEEESGETEEGSEDDEEYDEADVEPDVMLGSRSLVAPPLEVQLDRDLTSSGADTKGENEEDAAEEDTEEAKKLNRRAKKRIKEEREAEIRAAEEKRLRGDQAPETLDDFEALVRASPNSSFVWIKYMAFLIQLADIDKARAIAERALETINFREESEKLNVWVAYLNLENVYGSPPKEAVLELFQKALQYCDPKKLYFALLGIYENPQQPEGPKHDMADQLLKTMTRKYNTSAKVWLRQIQSLLGRGMGDAANKALEQGLKSLPRRKHIKVISRAAILEFRIGSPERARILFEGILRNYPKRTDLWSVYVDQEIRLGNESVIRALFERVICLELPPRKMKFLFKKYLDYEKAQGNEEGMEHVKTKAMEYVDAKLG